MSKTVSLICAIWLAAAAALAWVTSEAGSNETPVIAQNGGTISIAELHAGFEPHALPIQEIEDLI